MDQVFSHLSTDFPLAHFLRGGKAVDSLEGADPSSLANKVAKVAGSIIPGEPAAPASLGMAAGPAVLESVKAFAKETHASENGSQSLPGTTDGLKRTLQELVNSHPVMLFMKGNPKAAQCGFSQKVVDILKKEKVKFGSIDILTDNKVREGLKKFANWPTFPQLYCKGELIGGCDIAIAMHESSELRDAFRDHGIQILDNKVLTGPDVGKGGTVDPSGLSAATTSFLQTLIDSGPVVFMKGKPDEPKCGLAGK